MDNKAKPGDVIVLTNKDLVDAYGSEELTVIECRSSKYCGDRPWVKIRSKESYVNHEDYKIVKRGNPRTTIVGDGVDASLEKQRNDQLRDFFGFS